MTLSKTDLQTIAGVLAEQRKGLEFLRNTLQTDSRHLALMLKVGAVPPAPALPFTPPHLRVSDEPVKPRVDWG